MTYPEAVELIEYWARGTTTAGTGGQAQAPEPIIRDMSKDDMRALARSLGG